MLQASGSMATVKNEDSPTSALGDANPEISTSSGPLARTTRTVGTMTNGGQVSALESEDLVARRRERWRLKKREQRARLAARLAKTREKVTPLITAPAHFLICDANQQGGRMQTVHKTTKMVRRPLNYAPLSNGPKCRTPRQRFLEAQRHLKVKSVSSKLNIISVDSRDTLEQIVAKQREYWRLKKREQRAKLSMEAKARLQEKDSLMRRGRRYRKILEEIRRLRALEGGAETIGGFIKEDGTLSANVPQTRSLNVIKTPTSNVKTPVQSFSHLTVTSTQRPRKSGFPEAANRVGRTGCVTKMVISDKTLTKEDCLAKKREYWRVMKRQQRAARAARMRQGVTKAKPGLNSAPLLNECKQTNGIKEEQEQDPYPERAVCSDQKVPPLVSMSKCELTNGIKEEQDLDPYPEGAVCPDPKAAPLVPMSEHELTNGIKEEQDLDPHPKAPPVVPEPKRKPTNSIKQEQDQDPYPERAVCPDPIAQPLVPKSEPTNGIKEEQDPDPYPEIAVYPDPKALPLVPKSEPDPPAVLDFQATTLLAVTSMKKLLEESLSTVSRESDVDMKVKEEPVVTEVAPVAPAPDLDATSSRRPNVATSLQMKREYWKLMKRQQRARQKERRGKGGGVPPGSSQAPGLDMDSTNVGKTLVKLLPKPSLSLETAVLPPSPETPTVLGNPGLNRCTDLDTALPTLKPPENPLSSINLHPIEPLVRTVHSVPSELYWPSPPRPPKRRPGESEEDFLKRKREYWRIKKKEQRARKAGREKGSAPSMNPTPILHVQDFCQPLSDTLEHISNSVDTGVDSHYFAPLQGEEGTVSEATWRNFYLMDYDPLNQLLVCMACGEQQYSHSPEAALAHIDEAHPHTRALEPAERRCILEAWDEQVSRRERFFTRQLQQGGG
ncbi:uncharacterized protein si:dkey-28a3.2 isoform X2 [Corythoichthys intestinalis]|uniref:uncharacterized protein si:dkey-28a3.2 isoform X2 n=1 Tax=Corythoichthys intestinalis TaxID=161448 RepID=UPI0025A55915|nr:uncharacterized protein si:dkey-28a3.2 isoform X2 [Corythoichthys intestinalis]